MGGLDRFTIKDRRRARDIYLPGQDGVSLSGWNPRYLPHLPQPAETQRLQQHPSAKQEDKQQTCGKSNHEWLYLHLKPAKFKDSVIRLWSG
jgi:hypothetical protein